MLTVLVSIFFVLVRIDEARRPAYKPVEASIEDKARGATPYLSRPDIPTSDDPGFGLATYDWTLTDLNSEPVSFTRYQGRAVLLSHWATWCAPCVAEMPTIEALRDSLDEPRAAFLLVTDEEPKKVKTFLDNHPTSLPILLTHDGVPSALSPWGRPTTYLIDCEGRIYLKHVGGADWGAKAVVELMRHRIARSC